MQMDIKSLVERNIEQDANVSMSNIWRGRPAAPSDVKRIYSLEATYLIEDKLEEQNIMKLRLPMISRKSVEKLEDDPEIRQLHFQYYKQAPERSLISGR